MVLCQKKRRIPRKNLNFWGIYHISAPQENRINKLQSYCFLFIAMHIIIADIFSK